jgi:23S rRNA pseudouridine1911/1915/1917 synthase
VPVPGTIYLVQPAAAGERLDKWLAAPERLGSRSSAAAALVRGRVWVDEVEQRREDGARRLAGGERVRVWMDRPGSASVRRPRRTEDLDVVYEDADLLVLAKPPGVLTVPLPEQPGAESLADRVQGYWRSHGRRRPLAVHRLDRDTSGLVVFARTREAHAGLKAQFMARTPERVYLAVLRHTPAPPEGVWRCWVRWDPQAHRQRLAVEGATGAREAISSYRVIERFPRVDASLVEVRLSTGKRHQIRLHAWRAGCPIVGERLYVDSEEPELKVSPAFERQALHATRLGFAHPRDGRPLAFDLPPPADLAWLLGRLRRTRGD